jgi:23S rRNA (uridine2552-2'-O)-methyltransferase
VERALEDSGQIIALDILPMDPLDHVKFIQGDFTEPEPLALLEEALNGQYADLVLSDMAPNMSGMGAVDQPRAMYLAELALAFAEKWLEPGGSFVVKVFHGEGFDDFVKHIRSLFEKVQVKKPSASRPRSREVYVLGHRRKLQ